MDQKQLESISSFLEMSGFQYRVFDMGRKIQRISNQKFAAIESQQELYPYPFQQKAWLSILLWDEKKKQEPVIWFLSFPIDEMGLLKLESRDAFIRDLVENIGENMQANFQGGEGKKDTLKESPFSFKPREDRLAVFHSLATVELKQPPSQHYEHAREYLSGKLGFDQWQFLGLQGVADVIARLSQEGNAANLAAAIPNLPDMPLDTFMQALEHVKFSGPLSAAVVKRLQEESLKEAPQPPLLASLLRALSSSEAKQSRVDLIRTLLSSELAGNIDLLAAISGRCWLDLQDESLLHSFLEAAALQEQNVFNILLVDLMTLPDMRTKVLTGLRNPERSNDLSKKIGGFMGGMIV